MSLVNDWFRSWLVLPTKYHEIRPHQLVLAVTMFRVLQSTSMYQQLAKKLLNLVSRGIESVGLPLIMRGWIPDAWIRYGIRLQLQDRLNSLRTDNVEHELQAKQTIVQELHTMPIAIETDAANEQHYEVPAQFYDLCLGPAKKYSSGLWYVSN